MSRMVREILNELLISATDFDAYCQDFFNPVFRQFTAGMNRQLRENLLLQHHETEEILKALRTLVGSDKIELALKMAEERLTAQKNPSAQSGPPFPGAAYKQSRYIHRTIEENHALEALKHTSVLIFAPMQYGKTWLLQHLLDLLANEDTMQVRLNLELVDGVSFASLRGLLLRLAEQICVQLGLSTDVVTRVFHDLNGNPMEAMRQFLRLHILPRRSRLILALDDVHRVMAQQYADDFFGMLRGWMTDNREPLDRLRLLLASSIPPAEFIQGSYRSPTNTGTQIELKDFSKTAIDTLAKLYGIKLTKHDRERIHYWVGGHPYLVNLTLYQAAHEQCEPAQLLDNLAASVDAGVFQPFLEFTRRNLMKHTKMPLYDAFVHVAQGDPDRAERAQLEELVTYRLIARNPQEGRYHIAHHIHTLLLRGELLNLG